MNLERSQKTWPVGTLQPIEICKGIIRLGVIQKLSQLKDGVF